MNIDDIRRWQFVEQCAKKAGLTINVGENIELRKDGITVAEFDNVASALTFVSGYLCGMSKSGMPIRAQVPPGYYAVPASHADSCHSINGEKCAFLSDVGCNRRACTASERDDRLSVIFKKEE